MRIELPRESERLGAVIFYGVQKVFELDGGLATETDRSEENPTIWRMSYEMRQEIERQMAIVVPVRNERIRLIEGVLSGIPHDCLTLVVSNSPREPVDRFQIEKAAIERMAKFIHKDILVVHQRDPLLGRAFAQAGYPDLLDAEGLVRNGKAEGMLAATLLAKLCGKKYIGFVDADNYFPGAVLEYVREYSAGFAMSQSPYSMVRIAWHSKPKVVESSLFFAKRGRVSVRTNHILNDLISYYTGFGTEVIKTGNAGEHALSMDLAMLINYASGFAVEPYHFIDLWEKFGGILPSPYPEVIREQVEIFQIESRNPHLHEPKGDEHVEKMSYEAWQAVYHSPICPPPLKEELLQDMQSHKFIKKGEEPAKPNYYRPLVQVDLARFCEALQNEPYGDMLCAPPAGDDPIVNETASPEAQGRPEAAGIGVDEDEAAPSLAQTAAAAPLNNGALHPDGQGSKG
ncbi:MAG: mannosyl-3-phosphoglycerate synthase [Chloroflexota bacterium]